MYQSLINFIIRFKEYISLVAMVMISLSLISLGDVSKIGGFRTVVIGAFGWFEEAFAWIPNPAALKNENRALRELNLEQSVELAKTRAAMIENAKLRQMLNFKEKNPEPLVGAEVTGKATVQLRNYITVDRGYNAGIQPGMTVRTDAGLVGVVLGTASDYSLVELITNRNVKVAAKLERTLANGIVVWEGGQNLLLKNIPTSFDVKKGDVVVTSEFSNKYPSNVPIGTVSKIERDPGSLFFKVTVAPFASIASLEQVFIVQSVPNPEKNALLFDIEKRLMLRKKK